MKTKLQITQGLCRALLLLVVFTHPGFLYGSHYANKLAGSINLTVTSDATFYGQVGEEVSFTILVENDGSVALTDVTVRDDLSLGSWSFPTLAPGAVETIVTDYEITQDDMDAGSLVNTVKAEGINPDGDKVADSKTITVDLDPAAITGDLLASLEADTPEYDHVGQLITYTINVVNSTNVALYDLEIKDSLTETVWLLESMAMGDSQSFTTTYSITQQDMDEGCVVNTGKAEGYNPLGGKIGSLVDTLSICLDAAMPGPSLLVENTADPQTYSSVNQIIYYTFSVENTSPFSIYDINLGDDLTGENWFIPKLLPDQSQVFYATYNITQSDIDQQSVVSIATAAGKGPDGQDVVHSDQETIVLCPDCLPGQLVLSKSVLGSPTYREVGDVVTYLIEVHNTGVVTISDIDIEDELTGGSWFIPTLMPGNRESFQTTYQINQNDMDVGSVVNTAQATGFDVGANMVQAEASTTVHAVDRQADAMLTLSASQTVYTTEGERIDYDVTVSNTGNLTLSDILVNESLTGAIWSETTLAPGDQNTYAVSYTIGAADIDRTHVDNMVTLNATDPDNFNVSRDAEVTIRLLKIPGGLTPGAGFDETFFIDGLQYYPSNSLKVYNRQGSLVYEASPYQNDWDGVPNRGHILNESDGRVPAGTYFYVLVIEPDQDPITGYIYLIK